MKPKERKYNFVKALTDAYGFNNTITRKQIHEVYQTAPDKFSNCLMMEKELRSDRAEYKTPKTLDKYSGWMVPALKKEKTVKEVLEILSLDSGDDSYYNDYRNEEEDIAEIIRIL